MPVTQLMVVVRMGVVIQHVKIYRFLDLISVILTECVWKPKLF